MEFDTRNLQRMLYVNGNASFMRLYELKCFVVIGLTGLDIDLLVNTPMYGGHLIVYPLLMLPCDLYIFDKLLRSLNKSGFKFFTEIRYGLKDLAVGPIYIGDLKVLDKIVINAYIL